ncbi:MAG: hypothetical protein GVY25_03795 [Bacteroidetes bacterium]|nr:hypothetical protein [Bacteroidota bacterium]
MPEPLQYPIISRCISIIVACITLWTTATPAAAQNAAPVGLDDDYVVETGRTLSLGAPGILANDYDPNGDPISAVSYSGATDEPYLLPRTVPFPTRPTTASQEPTRSRTPSVTLRGLLRHRPR